MKQCFKCGKEKPIEEFYGHPRMGDGHLGKCKECAKVDAVKRRVLKLEEIKEYDRIRGRSPKRIAARQAYAKRRMREQPEKYRANYSVTNAVRDRRLMRLPCEVCGSPKSQAHHDDYSKPLDVRWLCETHHKERHRKYNYAELASMP